MPEFGSTHIDQPIGVTVPFASYTNFEDCVQKNRGKVDNPEAYCAVIKKKVEGEQINVVNEVLMSLGEIGDDGMLRGAQLMPLGSWKHPLGNIEMTPERAQRFQEQFKQNVAGQELPILWLHSDDKNRANPNFGKAAGWITDVQGDDQRGLIVDIKFSPEGKEAVNKKEFSYLSAEYFDKVQLPHHDAPQEDVLVAATLTNRPHLKGMNPLLNEETGHQFLLGEASQPIKGESPMDPILRQLVEQAQIEVSKDQTELTEEQKKKLDEWIEKLNETASKVPDLEKRLSELEDPKKVQARSLEDAGFVEEAQMLSEYRADRMVKTLEEFVPKGKVLSPAAQKEIRAYALEQTPDNLEKMHKMLLSEAATVDMRELGHKGGEEEDVDPDEQELGTKFLEEAQKIADEKKISLSEAVSEYATKHPEEFNAYQESVGGLHGGMMEVK